MTFNKKNPFSQFTENASDWAQNAQNAWKQAAQKSPYDEAFQRMENMTDQFFSSLGQNMDSGPKPSGAAMPDFNPEENPFLNPDCMKAMMEMNQIALCMIQTVMHQQQQYLFEVFQKMGQMFRAPQADEPVEDAYTEQMGDLSNATVQHYATVSETILKANQDIYQKFLELYDGAPAPFDMDDPIPDWPQDPEAQKESCSGKCAGTKKSTGEKCAKGKCQNKKCASSEKKGSEKNA